MTTKSTKLISEVFYFKKNGLKLLTLFVFFCFFLNVSAQDAAIWRKYTGELTGAAAAGIPELPNYSFAGYKMGEVEIPEATGTIFDITNYGAVANDDNSDEAAIEAAIAAAEAAGGGIVFFPPGEFIINAEPGNYEPILISGSNIVLKGSGSTPGGTILNMKNHMAQRPGSSASAYASSMISFQHPYALGSAGRIVEDIKKGDNFFVMDHPERINFPQVKYIRMDLDASNLTKGADGTDKYLGSISNRKGYWNLVSKGFAGKEMHEIDHVDLATNRVYIKDKFVDDLTGAHGWRARSAGLLENCGFEDIHFKANFTERFVHHRNYIHNSGWNAVSFGYVAHSWVRRCKFSNVTTAATAGLSYGVSFMQIVVDGNRGHNLVGAGWASKMFYGLIWDNTNGGQWHGVDFSGFTSGSVAWRIDTNARGLDIHGNYPRSNLFDLYTSSGVTGHGAAAVNQPNHLTGLTLWNQKRTGGAVSNYSWESIAVVADPIIVGYHGSSTSFQPSTVGYEESNGTKVSPESLYEAQLEHRIGGKPAWIDKAITDYEALKIAWYIRPPKPGFDYTETFENMSLNGWGTETYTGDHGFDWTVNAKGVSGDIDDSRNIYFQDNITGVQSGTITGGIGSFSVSCLDKWFAGNDRVIELLINGNVVDTFVHNGTEVYTYTVNDINIAGDVTIALRNASQGADNTLAIDDISWTSYTAPIPEPTYDYTETFENMSLNGWGTETYTGDHGFNWTVNAKGVSGDIDGSRNIYFQDNITGVRSGTITGGIGSFSVSCLDKWFAGNDRVIELLINGNVVDTFVHNGTEVYTYTVNDINIAGDVTIALRNASQGTDNMLAIDNISWNSYTAPIPEPTYDYTETFENMSLNGWGTETYTGDHGFNWTVNAKGVSGDIDGSRNIYFQDNITGVRSGTITGGIGSFSVSCLDKWFAGNDRVIELLINGNVVDTFVHNGTEVYTYTVNDINIVGDVTIALRNASQGTDNMLAIDNISWNSYTAPIPEPTYDYTETFENMSLNGWGTETYTGDHGFNWTVNAKGVSGDIDGSRNIYFQDNITGVQSGTITGGIGSFSVSCLDKWFAGNDRVIELLINGNVVDTFVHNGTEVYTYTVNDINIAGDVTIALRNASQGTDNMLAIDNISWTSFSNNSSSRLLSTKTEEVVIVNDNILIYPNPVGSEVNIKLSSNHSVQDIYLLDVRGKTIFKKSNVGNKMGNLKIGLSQYNLEQGLYFIKIIESDKTKTVKILKK